MLHPFAVQYCFWLLQCLLYTESQGSKWTGLCLYITSMRAVECTLKRADPPPPPSTLAALTQTPWSYLSTVTFQDRTMWPLPATIGCVEQQAGLRFRLPHGWGQQLPLTIKRVPALIKEGRGVSCGETVAEQVYPDPRVRTICHAGSISWQQHENEGGLFTAGPWPEEGVGAAGSRLRLCAALSL